MANPEKTQATKSFLLVGVDGSETSKQALRWALRQAQLTGADLRVVMAWHPPAFGYGTVTPLAVDFDFEKASRETLGREVEDVVGPAAGVQVSTLLVAGSAARELITAAKGAEMLVVGSRGRGAFGGMLLGSVSSHCVSHADCPVAVIRASQA